MNPALFLLMPRSLRRQIAYVVGVVAILLALPMLAVFALGTSTLSFLASMPSDSVGASPLATQTVGLYEGPRVVGDFYEWGNCTYWVFYLRQLAGKPIPTSWGNASTWAFYANIDGYQVDHTPAIGSIMQIGGGPNGWGHVAFVTAVDGVTGAWTISEMNVHGLDIVDLRVNPASAAASYNFIHDKGSYGASLH